MLCSVTVFGETNSVCEDCLQIHNTALLMSYFSNLSTSVFADGDEQMIPRKLKMPK